MHELHLSSLDLNLLLVLDALLAERSVTRASQRLGLSQPAVSHALGRLRDALGDPLLERDGRAMKPTPRALLLAPALREGIHALSRALHARVGPFDPSQAQGAVRVASADYAEALLLPALMKRLEREAPQLELWLHARAGENLELLHRGEVDLALTVLRGGRHLEGLARRELLHERFVCVVRKGHPAARGRFTLERYLAAGHVFVAPGSTRGSLVDELLARRGHERRIAVAVPHFLVAPQVVAQTDLVCTLGERVARSMARAFSLTLLPPPFELPGFTLSMVWSARREEEPLLRWVRERFAEVAAGQPTPRARRKRG